MNARPCPSCGSHLCDYVECYLEEPEADEGVAMPSLDDLIAKYGSQLTDVTRDIDPRTGNPRIAA